MIDISLSGWVGWVGLDTADTNGSFFNTELDVTVVTPAGSPGVSDEVVFLTIFSSVSNSGDGVAGTGWAGFVVHDTGFITSEVGVSTVDRDRCWSSGNGGEKLRSRFWSDSVVGVNLNLTFAAAVMASSILSLVWVITLEFLWVFFTLGETIPGVTSIATVTGRDAVDKFLFRKAEKLTSLDLMASFNGCSR